MTKPAKDVYRNLSGHSCHGWAGMLRAPTQGGPDERSGDATMQTRLNTQSHADLIRSVLAGHRTGLPIDEVIRRSWSRCLTTDRKSTRLNSSHLVISYAVFCLKKHKTRKSCRTWPPSSSGRLDERCRPRRA